MKIVDGMIVEVGPDGFMSVPKWVATRNRTRLQLDDPSDPVPFADGDYDWPPFKMFKRAHYLKEMLEAVGGSSLELLLKVSDELDASFSVFLEGLPPKQRELLLAKLAASAEWAELHALRERNAERAQRHLAQHRERAKRCQ